MDMKFNKIRKWKTDGEVKMDLAELKEAETQVPVEEKPMRKYPSTPTEPPIGSEISSLSYSGEVSAQRLVGKSV